MADSPEDNDNSSNNAENIPLQPKLDSIFADVESNLPSIDFDISDVSMKGIHTSVCTC